MFQSNPSVYKSAKRLGKEFKEWTSNYKIKPKILKRSHILPKLVVQIECYRKKGCAAYNNVKKTVF